MVLQSKHHLHARHHATNPVATAIQARHSRDVCGRLKQTLMCYCHCEVNSVVVSLCTALMLLQLGVVRV